MSIAATSLPAVSALPAPRAQVALAVATGASVTEAAQNAGVHRSTVYDWIRSDPGFSAAVDEARQEYIGLLRDQLRSLSVKALNRIESLLDDPGTPPWVALRAALAVLNRPRFPDQGWTLPESVGEEDWLVCPEARSAEWTDRPVLLRQQQDTPTENDALLEADYKAHCQRERLKRASAEPRSPDTTRHNPTPIVVLSPPPTGDPMPASLSASASWREPLSASSAPLRDSLSEPLREPLSARPSRNAPCPCGSGKKYKGCCGAKPSPPKASKQKPAHSPKTVTGAGTR